MAEGGSGFGRHPPKARRVVSGKETAILGLGVLIGIGLSALSLGPLAWEAYRWYGRRLPQKIPDEFRIDWEAAA